MFTHLKVQTHYSFLASTCRVNMLVDKVKEYQMTSVALTDAGNLYGVVEFFKACKKKQINPIIGMNIYLVKDRSERSGRGHGAKRMTLLAKDSTGYQNLLKISSIGFMEGFYYVPRVDWEVLERYNHGLIALSGFFNGVLQQEIEENKEETIHRLKDLYGAEDVFLEVQRHGIQEREELVVKMAELAHKHQVGLVATNEVLYLDQEDSVAHDTLLCLRNGSVRSDTNRFRMPCDQFYLKNSQEMEDLFKDYPEAIKNTQEIANRCQVELDFETRHLPSYYVNQEDKGDIKQELKKQCYQGLERLSSQLKEQKEVNKRLEFELNIINQMGFADYFLIVADLINHARSVGIPVGPGRGSAAGSLVSYLLGITEVNPLQFNLLFERFLNPERVSMPDIDIDFCKERRNEVIEYVTQKYGRNRVAQIITFGTMAARMVLRDVGRVLQVSLGEIDKIAKFVPSDPGMTLKKALESVEELQELSEENETYKELFKIAFKLEGLVRQSGIHAAGIVIGESSLDKMTPLAMNNKEVTTQYEAWCLEELGLLKMDFLGLKTLTMISTACEMIQERHGKTLNMSQISLEDEKTYQLLSTGNTVGIFQLESDGMRQLASRMGVEKFSVLVALLALYRPGPLEWAGSFIDRKKGKEEIIYDHPLMEEILIETYGIMLYQEQVMQVVSRLAGFTLAEADLLRRAMGKKKVDVMKSQREKFIKGCYQHHQVAEDKANQIFDNIQKFAGYGFNKSHSVAYAFISYQCAYLKAHYPQEYMASVLTHSVDNPDKVRGYIEESKRMGYTILAPDVNESRIAFTAVDKGIRFGLKAIKNVGQGAIENICQQRDRKEGKKFKDIRDFLMECDLQKVNKRVLESLVKSGALDCFNQRREMIWENCDTLVEESSNQKKDLEKGQGTLFGVFKEQLSERLFSKPVKNWSLSKKLQYEKELLGFYVTGHPVQEYQEHLDTLRTHTAQACEQEKISSGTKISVCGEIISIHNITTRSRDKMAFLTLEDETGRMEVVLFPREYEDFIKYTQEGYVVRVEGKWSWNSKRKKNQISADSVIACNQFGAIQADRVDIYVGFEQMNQEEVDKIFQICQTYPGNIPVRVIVEVEQKEQLSFESEYKVKQEDCIFLKEDLEQLESIQKVSFFCSPELMEE